MSVHYVPYQGEMVSRQWAVILAAIGNPPINEGHRTMARQAFFFHCWNCKCCNNGNLAAAPSPSAPHIKTGRPDHAIDFPLYDAAMAALTRLGLEPRRTAGAGTSNWEPWHIEVDSTAMARVYRELKPDKWDALPKHLEEWVRKLIFHRHGAAAKKGKNHAAYLKHVGWRKWYRAKLERALKRADKPAVKELLREALR